MPHLVEDGPKGVEGQSAGLLEILCRYIECSKGNIWRHTFYERLFAPALKVQHIYKQPVIVASGLEQPLSV
ncbi:MAG: hypothetical protein D6816_00895 [Bacteroidetes bacterium]|nr:MAG: hypothetical protein D6816_00895 [Bacteroidota bacterium]